MAGKISALLASAPFVDKNGLVTSQALAFLNGVFGAVQSAEVGTALKVSMANGLNIYVGSGSPNGQITDKPPAIYLNSAGGAGTTLYVKESGANTNTGWVGK